jgi:hypothetical protein
MRVSDAASRPHAGHAVPGLVSVQYSALRSSVISMRQRAAVFGCPRDRLGTRRRLNRPVNLIAVCLISVRPSTRFARKSRRDP